MKKKGFTLIELLIVIAIIGLLSTLAIISMSGARAKARDAQRLSDLKQIQTALEILYSDANTYDPGCETTGNCTVPYKLGGNLAGGEYIDFTKFNDPLTKGTGTACDCTTAALLASGCDYAVVGQPDATDYEICAMIEKKSEKFSDAPTFVKLTPSGVEAVTLGGG